MDQFSGYRWVKYIFHGEISWKVNLAKRLEIFRAPKLGFHTLHPQNHAKVVT
jgi:hypothetical protein